MKHFTWNTTKSGFFAGVCAFCIAVATPVSVSAQFNPPQGANNLDDLLSPRTLATGNFGLLPEYPAASAVNPAAAAHIQRSYLDFSYLAAIDLSGGSSAWDGHVINLGGLHPTAAGVFTGNMQLAFADMDSLQVGNTARLQGSFAKPLYETILFGAGLDVITGTGDQWDFGVSASLGVIHDISGSVDIPGARYGIAIDGIGKWYRGYSSLSPYPSPFSPNIEFAFTPVATPSINWDVYSQLSAPSFQNVELQIGTELGIQERLDLQTGLRFNARDIIAAANDPGHYIPSIGINLRFLTNLPAEEEGLIADRGWDQNELHVRGAAAPQPNETWIFGVGLNAALGLVDDNPPEISIESPDEVYISPNNDGTQDSLEFPVEITDERYITGYRLVIEAEDGEAIRTIENIDQRPDSAGVRNIIDRLLEVKEGIPVPETLRWNGRTDEGSDAADGEYRFYVEAWDDNDNLAVSQARSVTVDTQAPDIEIATPARDDLIFSPSEQSVQTTVRIPQQGSHEDLWTGEILDSSERIVRSYTWEDSAPEAFEWDGMNDNGDVVPDGVYTYRVSSVDRAGNRSSESLANIIVNTEPTPVDLAVSRSIFSPNDNGVNDTIHIVPEIGNTRGIRTWNLDIHNAADQIVREYSDIGEPRSGGVRFDGRNSQGETLPEGAYYAKLVVEYNNGSRPEARSPGFTIDVTPPSATVQVEHPVFSPNNSGIRDSQIFFQESSEEEEWKGTIQDYAGRNVRELTWYGTAPERFEWDGRTDDGGLADDGMYSYTLSATDKAGNSGNSNTVEFELNTEETPVLVTTNHDAFSPNGQGYKDTISILPNLKKYDDIEYFTFEISTTDGEVVRSASGSGTLTDPFVWDGRDQDGIRVSDGAYRAELEILYMNGNLEIASTSEFLVDTQAPEAELSAEYLLFSPDGDNRRDSVPFTQNNISGDFWIGAIRNTDGETVRQYRWGQELDDFEWDGRDEEGNRLPDGEYNYELRSEDEAGNRSSYTVEGINIDTRPTSVFVTVQYPAISPEASQQRAEQNIDLFVNLVEGAENWQLQIIDSDSGSVVRSFAGSDVESSFAVDLDGTDEAGNVVEGVFQARFAVEYTKGNRPTAVTRDFQVDVTPPDANIDLWPIPFSPDNDGVDDTLNIELNLEDDVEISEWQFEIFDRNDKLFHLIRGNGMPGTTLSWDGVSSVTGELVISAEDYPYVFTVTDVLGNTAEYTGTIPVDILVIRDGDRLKVQIPSITFSPNSPELIIDEDEEVGRKNRRIVARLVEIFTRYSNYRIQVEGHAVNVTGTQEEQVEELLPLSEQRAQRVRDALIEGGLDPDRVSAVGRGGMEPIVPHDDLEERWKNRRVEFILIR